MRKWQYKLPVKFTYPNWRKFEILHEKFTALLNRVLEFLSAKVR